MPPKSLEQQINGWCKHYTGTGRSETCRAGVNYNELGDGSRPGMLNRLPCLREHLKEDTVAECALREWHTSEEIAERIAKMRAGAMRTVTARAAIFDFLKANGKPTRNVGGQIPCPICNSGTLRFSIAYNGHCHGSCTPAGCVNWIE